MSEGSTRTAEGMLSLSWNNHSAAFSQMLTTLREKESYADVTLACEGKFYPVHKFVLSTCSDYFFQMFERTQCKHPIIILKDVHCREMEALLSYMYAGIVCVPQSDLPQLILVAEALQIKGLAVPDETMCTNKRMAYTWSPTDDRISPHAKRLRQDDSCSGMQYQRLSDGHTIIKPQTLTGIPSFASGVPVSRGYSPTAPAVVKHVQPNTRPAYNTTLPSQRFSPYPRETERQQSSPRLIQKLEVKENQGSLRTDQNHDGGDCKKLTEIKFKTSVCTQSNGNGSSASQPSQSSHGEMIKEILPETAVKVELEEGTESLNVDGTIIVPMQSSNQVSGRRRSFTKVDAKDISKTEFTLREEKEKLDETTIKKEVDIPEEKSVKKLDCSVNTTSNVANNKETQTSKEEQPPFPSSHQETVSESPSVKSNTSDAGTNWEGDDDSSHPLDLSDTHKQHTAQLHESTSLQSGTDSSSPGIKRMYDNVVTKFPCPYCNYRTYHKSQLMKHVGTHTAENPFRCPYCPFRAPLHISLRDHLETHQSGGSEGSQ